MGFGLFGCGNSTDDSGSDSSDTEYKTVEREAEYTEHTAVATFSDDEQREFTFDSMTKSDGAITLKNYTGYNPPLDGVFGHSGNFIREAFITIPFANLKTFETVDRTERTIEYEIEVEVEAESDD